MVSGEGGVECEWVVRVVWVGGVSDLPTVY